MASGPRTLWPSWTTSPDQAEIEAAADAIDDAFATILYHAEARAGPNKHRIPSVLLLSVRRRSRRRHVRYGMVWRWPSVSMNGSVAGVATGGKRGERGALSAIFGFIYRLSPRSVCVRQDL